MQWATFIGAVVIAFFMLRQDVKERAISWPLFPLLLACVLMWWWKSGLDWMHSVLINSIFLCLNLCFCILWFGLKKVRPKELLQGYMGLGDILLFLVLAVSLPYTVFVPFQLCSLFIALLLGVSVFKGQSVPLAGLQAGMLVMMMAYMQFFQISANGLEYLFT